MSPAGGPHIKNATDPVRRENRTGPCRQRCPEAGIGFASCNEGGMPAVDAEQPQGARVWRRIVRRMRHARFPGGRHFFGHRKNARPLRSEDSRIVEKCVIMCKY